MSHFTVLVKIKPDKLKESHGDVKIALIKMLEPYQENNMGDCPKEYLVFHDATEEVYKDAEKIIVADSYMGREHPDFVGEKLLEVYSDIDALAEEYCGYKKDPTTGRYGYWENPNAKWDWYQIGGRWSGLLPVKQGGEGRMGKRSLLAKDDPLPPENYVDIVKVKDLDFDVLALKTTEQVDKFWQNWLRLKEIENDPSLKNAEDRWLGFTLHEQLCDMGIRKCVKPREPMFDENGNPVIETSPLDNEPKQKWTDPKFEDAPFTKDDLYSKYRWNFEWHTFAVLDDNGWHEKGEMGWWACSSDTLEDRENWGQTYFERFLASEDPETTLVVVDCHI